jgi:hypothetical protein
MRLIKHVSKVSPWIATSLLDKLANKFSLRERTDVFLGKTSKEQLNNESRRCNLEYSVSCLSTEGLSPRC